MHEGHDHSHVERGKEREEGGKAFSLEAWNKPDDFVIRNDPKKGYGLVRSAAALRLLSSP